MAHFAKLDENNIVLNIEVVDNANCLDENGNESEEVGRQYLENVHGWTKWKQTSYNTKENKHYKNDGTLSDDQSKAFRKNYAGIGYIYDEDRDAFIPPKLFASWVLNETTCVYEAPVAFPTVTEYGDPVKFYNIVWDEANGRWVATDQESPEGNHRWDATAKAWVAL
jgi:hypothetical protein